MVKIRSDDLIDYLSKIYDVITNKTVNLKIFMNTISNDKKKTK